MTDGSSEQRAAEVDAGLLDVIAHLAQSVVSIIRSDDLLEKIPVARIGVVAWKLLGSVRDQLLLNKLNVCLTQLASVPVDQRCKMTDRLRDDPDFNQSVGEHLIELMDRLDGMRKPAMVGAALRAFINAEIDVTQLRRLETAIERLPAVEIDKIREFGAKSMVAPRDEYSETLQALINAGFFSQVNTVGSGVAFKPTNTCRVLLQLELDRVKPS